MDNGIVSPGVVGFGTLTSTGNTSFAANSQFNVDVNAAGMRDQVATDTATIDGGTVMVNAPAGMYALGQTFDILSANNPVTVNNDFVVMDNNPFADFEAVYSGTLVQLRVLSMMNFVNMANTRNQFSIGAAIDTCSVGATGDALTAFTGRRSTAQR